MKSKVILFPVILFLLCNTSCIILAKHDNGKHKGWYKNPRNPHHPSSTKSNGKPGNPGKGNKK